MLCHYAKCHYAECGILFTIMVSVVMLNVVMLSVVAPNKVLHSFDQCYKTFTAFNYKYSLYARAFVLGKPLQLSPMIASKPEFTGDKHPLVCSALG
jgi:hypothetical protein